jgi:hypothetical protein
MGILISLDPVECVEVFLIGSGRLRRSGSHSIPFPDYQQGKRSLRNRRKRRHFVEALRNIPGREMSARPGPRTLELQYVRPST